MKDARGAIKLITFIAIIILLILVAFGGVILSRNTKKDNKNSTDEWKKINIGNGYCENTIIELDLDGDNIKEEIDIKTSGKYITINSKEYTVNKYFNESNSASNTVHDYNINHYHIVDLNSDGILEIIHRTFSDMISPITSKYTIYNYTNNKLKEIGNISIIGNIPNEIYVKENIIKFEYWPYESSIDYTEEVICELDV